MTTNDLKAYKEKLAKLTEEENILRDLELKKFYDGLLMGPMTNLPSVDKPWLKYYNEEAINFRFPKMTAYDFMRKNNEEKLDSYAINFYGKRITYKEFFNKITEAEMAFRNLGIEKGDYVTFCMPTLPETVYSFYALNKIGATCNMIDLRMNKERILKYINDTNSKLVVSFNGYSEKVYEILKDSTATKMIDVDITDSLKEPLKSLYKLKVKKAFDPNKEDVVTWKKFIKAGENINREAINKDRFKGYNPDIPAAIVYTGGTTGEPKGAILSNDSLNLSCIQYGLADIPRGYNDGFLNIMPPFIAYGLVNGIHFPISLGMEDILIPKFDPKDFASLLKKHKPAHLVGIPLHYETLMNDESIKDLDLSFIKNAGCGGDTIPKSLETKVNEFLKEHNGKHKFRAGFGMTENAAMSIFDTNNNMTKEGTLGIPMQKNNIGVFDPDGNELRYNEVGELRITSPQIINGYNNNPEETNKTIITVNGQRWIKTGDYASIDENGHVSLLGRKKTMLIRPDGHNVWPDVIKNNLFSCPIIKDVAVIGVKSKHNEVGEIPTAIVELKDKTMNPEEAKNIIFEHQSHLAGERDGALEIRFRDSIPKTSIGKTDVITLTKEENKILSDIDFDQIAGKTKKKVLK